MILPDYNLPVIDDKIILFCDFIKNSHIFNLRIVEKKIFILLLIASFIFVGHYWYIDRPVQVKKRCTANAQLVKTETITSRISLDLPVQDVPGNTPDDIYIGMSTILALRNMEGSNNNKK